MRSRLLVVAVIIGLGFVLVGASALLAESTNDDKFIRGSGTVKFVSLEGGFYGIVSDDGKKYDPVNLPQEFNVDGLRVQFTANLTDSVTFHMWGYVVKLISIERSS